MLFFPPPVSSVYSLVLCASKDHAVYSACDLVIWSITGGTLLVFKTTNFQGIGGKTTRVRSIWIQTYNAIQCTFFVRTVCSLRSKCGCWVEKIKEIVFSFCWAFWYVRNCTLLFYVCTFSKQYSKELSWLHKSI